MPLKPIRRNQLVAKRPFNRLFLDPDCRGFVSLQTRDRFEFYGARNSVPVASMVYGTILSLTTEYRGMVGSAKRNIQRQLRKMAKKDRKCRPVDFKQLRRSMLHIQYHADQLAYALHWIQRHDPLLLLESKCLEWLADVRDGKASRWYYRSH